MYIKFYLRIKILFMFLQNGKKALIQKPKTAKKMLIQKSL